MPNLVASGYRAGSKL